MCVCIRALHMFVCLHACHCVVCVHMCTCILCECVCLYMHIYVKFLCVCAPQSLTLAHMQYDACTCVLNMGVCVCD